MFKAQLMKRNLTKIKLKKDNYKMHDSKFRVGCCNSMSVKLWCHHVISHHAQGRASQTAFLTEVHHLNWNITVPEIVKQ